MTDLYSPRPDDAAEPAVVEVVETLAAEFPTVPSQRVLMSAAYAWRAVALVGAELLEDVRLVELIARADLESRLAGRESPARVFGVRQPQRRH